MDLVEGPGFTRPVWSTSSRSRCGPRDRAVEENLIPKRCGGSGKEQQHGRSLGLIRGDGRGMGGPVDGSANQARLSQPVSMHAEGRSCERRVVENADDVQALHCPVRGGGQTQFAPVVFASSLTSTGGEPSPEPLLPEGATSSSESFAEGVAPVAVAPDRQLARLNRLCSSHTS
ncbi:hypothetical protein ACFCV9_18450 [Streptomyces sp. NPDC056367]|uniref:hypothetical protein n=1 Tax=Streptomyces sp. NPDC056367 TaxID=3345797 RepID=UPI0035DF9228